MPAENRVGCNDRRDLAENLPAERLAEVLATGDIHLVPLRTGLASASVPSKIYSVLAAGRPVIASIDLGSEVARLVTEAGAGVVVGPGDPDALIAAVEYLAEGAGLRARMGADGRAWVEKCLTSRAVATTYLNLFEGLVKPLERRRVGNDPATESGSV